MTRRLIGKTQCAALGLAVLLTGGMSFAGAKKGKATKPAAAAVSSAPAVLWTNPADLETRNLFDGPGGAEHAPKGPYKFDKEDLDGTNPKFVVKDKDGVKWKVKLGIETRPETVATRLVWAVGYYANEDYFLPELQVKDMPAKLHRGQNLVGPNGTMQNVRLKREDDKKIGTWQWRTDPFTGTRELNGLRTLMAVINNWDLKDENNAIYEMKGDRVFAISDLGATFGCAGRCWPRDRTKGDLEKYQQSKFISHLTADTVSFQTPARPRYLYAVNPKEYLSRIRLEWIGRNVPRADAKWMGTMLARLSPQQLQDAFRSAGYSQQDIDGFCKVLSSRISALTDL
jgi:hypothetical protein